MLVSQKLGRWARCAGGLVPALAGPRTIACQPEPAPAEVQLLDGTVLPCEMLGSSKRRPLIWGHGLGPQEPWSMNRRTCESFSLIADAVGWDSSNMQRGCDDASFSAVLYDARGHGGSSGWEVSASHIEQFHWRNLAIDMLFVADRHRSLAATGAILGGYSMGASSALWAAYLCPTSVRGLVLLSVTTAWEIRAARRG